MLFWNAYLFLLVICTLEPSGRMVIYSLCIAVIAVPFVLQGFMHEYWVFQPMCTVLVLATQFRAVRCRELASLFCGARVSILFNDFCRERLVTWCAQLLLA